ncbi:MAG: GerMN domain-containing protein [Lachnospiraceae bacterium]|nr:GerMN domain-containing protein [Lachnospiraceae bacterium]
MRYFIKKSLINRIWILVLSALLLTGCSTDRRPLLSSDSETYLYYVTTDDSAVVPVPFEVPELDFDDDDEEYYYGQVIRTWIDALSGTPENLDYKSPIDNGLSVNSITYLSGQVTLDFNSVYLQAPGQTEVLRRAAIVKTLSQIEGVESIAFTVDGMPITDSKQVPIGAMTADTFVSNPGAEINAYETTKVLVYFADEEGNMLIGRTENVGYISNISMERLVVDRVIAGPLNDKAYPTVSPTLKVLNVTTKDGICYVNLDNSFLTKTLKVSDEVVIYSFVNSLTELPNVGKVQFMIDSETEVSFGDHIYLSEPFERNLEIISTTE